MFNVSEFKICRRRRMDKYVLHELNLNYSMDECINDASSETLK